MKARKKGTNEWKEYREVHGTYGEFLGLETLGQIKSVDEIVKEVGLKDDPFAKLCIQPEYQSAILPLEAFDLWQEPDWSAFRREAAKDILSSMVSSKEHWGMYSSQSMAKISIELADELIKQLKEQ